MGEHVRVTKRELEDLLRVFYREMRDVDSAGHHPQTYRSAASRAAESFMRFKASSNGSVINPECREVSVTPGVESPVDT